jgi:hypothetical protein
MPTKKVQGPQKKVAKHNDVKSSAQKNKRERNRLIRSYYMNFYGIKGAP